MIRFKDFFACLFFSITNRHSFVLARIRHDNRFIIFSYEFTKKQALGANLQIFGIWKKKLPTAHKIQIIKVNDSALSIGILFLLDVLPLM